jgi:hypothetical protein
MKRTIKWRNDPRENESKYCRHFLAGRSEEPKRCLLNQECFHCAFDQWIEALEERDETAVLAVAA